MVRSTTVVSAQAMAPPMPSKSPQCCCGVWPPTKPSRKVKPTARKASSKPIHCKGASRSDLINQGKTSAAHKGAVYKNTVMREAAVNCKPVKRHKNSMANKIPANKPGQSEPSRCHSGMPRHRRHSQSTTLAPAKRRPAIKTGAISPSVALTSTC